MTQQRLASEAQVSARHVSFLENGRSRPSREMVLVLASVLELGLRDRNVLLDSAGFAPVYSSSELEGAALAPVRRAIELVLVKQEPYASVLMDRCWNVLRFNEGAVRMFGALFAPGVPAPVQANLVRAALHPAGLRRSLLNWEDVASRTLARLERDCTLHPEDEERHALRDEVRGYPGVEELPVGSLGVGHPVAVINLRVGTQEVTLSTLLTTVGTPLDVTAQELIIESFYPADEASDAWIKGLGVGSDER